ncbi:MAG: c-type cytochrome [Planctomycetaceae bacterium]|nr:c-type cytochrome [Planctomycetaceae bacterium]
MDISTDGTLLVCSNRDNGSISVIDLARLQKSREFNVGHLPEGVSFIGDTHTVAVAVYGEDRIVFVDADQGQQLGNVDVFDEPYGVVSNRSGSHVYVTLDYPGQVVEIDAETRQIDRTFNAGTFARGIAIAEDARRLYVTNYFTAQLLAIDLETGDQVDEWTGTSYDNLCRQVVLNPHREKAYLPHLQSRTTFAHAASSIFPYVAVVNTSEVTERRRRRIKMDSFNGAQVTSNPWEIAVSPDGRRLYVVFSGTNDMYVSNVLDDDYWEIEFERHERLGHNPRAIRVAPDSQTIYVYNALDFHVVAYDAETIEPIATIDVCENPLSDEVLTGKRLFYSALQPMSGRHWISCSSCHPDGDPDGRTWQNPEGLRNTQALFGMAWTHPIHWSADRDEVQDFEHTIRGDLMQGRGLIKGEVHPSLEEPNLGLSASLDALAAYSNTHEFTLSPHAKDGLSDTAERGRELFFSEETKCATCHGGPFFTDSTTGQLHDVGTGTADQSEKMAPAYDTPTLLGVYRTAPYLHHGMAVTLEDVLTTQNPNDLHGKTSHLSVDEINDLVAFLKSLPYKNPQVAAEAAGLLRVEP